MPRNSTDTTIARERNKRTILNLIRTRYPISRTELAAISRLNKATVSMVVSDLIRKGIVAEAGCAASAVGRRPVLLRFLADSAYVIGVVLNVDRVRLAVTDLEGRVVHEAERALTDVRQAQILQEMTRMMEEAMAAAAKTPRGVVAIGIGLPGLVDDRRGAVLFTPNMDLHHVELKRYLRERFSVPVFVDNSANVSAFGEKLVGAGRAWDHFVYISVSTGIGAGIVMNGELQRGADGFAGEIGHMVVEPDGLPCSCGSNGCWEMYGSLKALYRWVQPYVAGELPAYHPSVLDHVMAAAAAGEVWAADALAKVGRYLGIGLANIVNILNPQAVLIGNDMARAEPWLRPVVTEVIAARCSPELREHLAVVFVPNGHNTAVVGAASLGIHGYLESLVRQGARA
ncbi:xylose repressor [Alicyclobacillus cellulosilyticus]|uniref:Xylose repressor n=1 Tax=Alicyclobacillus cellulosilyticus TaxID=1003997 RepID=A0A917NI26_9BACL|nr:ROK family transcriptional regulator [Alicyclobacillus cellulosilyticus]GGJ02129.1 xylose repressor [Alicyclobacillus cellulosilyticus]